MDKRRFQGFRLHLWSASSGTARTKLVRLGRTSLGKARPYHPGKTRTGFPEQNLPVRVNAFLCWYLVLNSLERFNRPYLRFLTLNHRLLDQDLGWNAIDCLLGFLHLNSRVLVQIYPSWLIGGLRHPLICRLEENSTSRLQFELFYPKHLIWMREWDDHMTLIGSI